jgi:hypothetical protein
MSRSLAPHVRSALAIAALLAPGACTTRPAPTLVAGEQASLAGEVVSVDTTPWAYDGPATVTIAAPGVGTVAVRLPARWNLCKAAPPGDVQALRPGDRVQVVGTVTAADTVLVCERPEHVLRKRR